MAQLPQQMQRRRPILTLASKPKRKIDEPPDSVTQRQPDEVELPSRREDPDRPDEHPDSPPRDGDRETTEGESEQATAERTAARQELKDLEQNR